MTVGLQKTIECWGHLCVS